MPGLLHSLDLGLWGSGGRICASNKLDIMGRASPGSVAPDVAAVIDELKRRELASFATIVSAARSIDGEITEAVRREGGQIPTGSSYFDPVYRQYLMLEAAPVASENPEGLWWSMPAEHYLISRLGTSDPATVAILTDLGYVASYNSAAAGGSPFIVSEEEANKAIEVRRILLEEFGVDSKVPAVAVAIIWTAVALAAAATVVILAPSIAGWIDSRVLEQGAENAANENARRQKWNMPRSETAPAMIDGCLRHANANNLDPARCAAMLDRITPYEAPLDPTEAAARYAGLLSCKWTECLGWAAGGLAVGVTAGAIATSRLRGNV